MTFNAKFLEFWQEYPSKVGKLYAYQCWQKQDKKFGIGNGHFNELIEALKLQKETERFKNYPPNPSTWLNQGRWMDESEPKEKKPWEV